jgi:hypothetical protein
LSALARHRGDWGLGFQTFLDKYRLDKIGTIESNFSHQFPDEWCFSESAHPQRGKAHRILFSFEYLPGNRQQFTVTFLRCFAKVDDWLGEEFPYE